MVNRVLIDNGSRENVIFKDTIEKIGILDIINKAKTTIHTFNRDSILSLGKIKLAIQAEPYNHLVTLILWTTGLHNIILGRNWLHKMSLSIDLSQIAPLFHSG